MIEPRQQALEVLYEAELSPAEPADESADPSLHPKALRLIAGVREHRVAIDEQIEAASDNWSVGRMPVVDATVLRIATFELAYEDTPVAVIINEAVELAKTFSTEASGAFVNGLLAGVAHAVREST